jgi:formate dehydrogenase iron-sulfur subunit
MAPSVGFFTDTTLCIGCKACEVACKEWNELPGHEPQFRDSYDNTGQLDHQNFRHVQFLEKQTAKGGIAWTMMSDVCKHCSNAACMEVCPTDAIVRTEFGTVYIRPDVCNGCRDCIAACPYHVIGFNEQKGVVQKCTFCYDRLQKNLKPACAKVCPTESIKFGDLETMKATAKARVAQLQGQGVAEAQLYGENEYGGLHALFLLTDQPKAYGLPDTANAVSPRRNNRRGYLGSFVTGVLALLGALFMFRQRGQGQEAKE